MVFCVHVDADDSSDENVLETRINLLRAELEFHPGNICKNIVPIIPVYMTEAWMLADIPLLKEEIGTKLSDQALGLSRDPETVADPKGILMSAIRIARENLSKKRRRELSISDLYQPIGQQIRLEALEQLQSYIKFKQSVRDAYKSLNYLH